MTGDWLLHEPLVFNAALARVPQLKWTGAAVSQALVRVPLLIWASPAVPQATDGETVSVY
jgi:hypothetical protein